MWRYPTRGMYGLVLVIRILSLTWQRGRHGNNSVWDETHAFLRICQHIYHSFRLNLSAAQGTGLFHTVSQTPLVFSRNTGYSIYLCILSPDVLFRRIRIIIIITLHLSPPQCSFKMLSLHHPPPTPHECGTRPSMMRVPTRMARRQPTNHQRITKPAIMSAGGNVFTPWSLVTISQDSCLWEINMLAWVVAKLRQPGCFGQRWNEGVIVFCRKQGLDQALGDNCSDITRKEW